MLWVFLSHFTILIKNYNPSKIENWVRVPTELEHYLPEEKITQAGFWAWHFFIGLIDSLNWSRAPSSDLNPFFKYSLIGIMEFMSQNVTKDKQKLQQMHKVSFSLFFEWTYDIFKFKKILICAYRVYLSTHIHLEMQLNGISRREDVDAYFQSRGLEACLNNTNLSLIEYWNTALL